jgi:predicted phage baseplate assembly protein
LVAWSASRGEVERTRVLTVNDDPPAGGLSWAPALEHEAQHMSVAVKAVHLFGYDAPPSFIASALEAPTSGNPSPTVQLTLLQAGASYELNGEEVPYDYALAPTTTIELDALYDELEPGDRILIASPSAGETVRATVTAVTPAPARFGPLQATVSQITLDTATPEIADRRGVELIVLGDELSLWEATLPAHLEGEIVYAMIGSDQAPLHGQAVALSDASGFAYETTVVSSMQAPDLPEALAISLAGAPSQALEVASAVLLGNVVPASHGMTVKEETLGIGDATIPGQRLPLGKPPVTFLPHPGSPHGGRSTLVVRVGGVQWTELEYLYGAGPQDRVFVVEREDDGSYQVRFGDGVIGARLPSGAQVTAEYRTGLGSAGNVQADALRLPLTRPTGLVSVYNPIAAGGGADPETVQEARANAPNTVRTFERIVSLRDAEDQARANALVAKASAAWITVGGELGVGLTVAGPGGEVLGSEQLAELRADLDARRDPNRALRIRGYTPLALRVALRLIAIEADLRPDDVTAAVQAALLAQFGFQARQFGQPVRLSEVFVAAQDTPGVLGVEVEELTLAEASARASHLLSAAAVQERIDLAPPELATLAPEQLSVKVG